MKLFLNIFICITASLSAVAQEVTDFVAGGPVLEFINKTVDFGEFYAIHPQSGVIRYRNAGDEPLMLLNVTGDCGCTVVKYSHDPLPPDSVGTISVRFNGKGRKPGEFRKMIRIRSNSRNGIEHAFIEGTVAKSLVR